MLIYQVSSAKQVRSFANPLLRSKTDLFRRTGNIGQVLPNFVRISFGPSTADLVKAGHVPELALQGSQGRH
jgi:hypothetical protein